MKAAILCIGTELTMGQILNRNSHWIADRLSELGIPCTMHIAVPDQHDLIIESLNLLESNSDLLFLTGGLGPTTDDFTRQVVAEWAQTVLQFDENSWQHLSAQLAKRGAQAKPIHRQECYFPENALILHNRVGTAQGFQLLVRQKHLFVLPGPPREIEAIWQDQLTGTLNKLTENLDRLITHKWQTLGRGESEIAQLIQPLTTNCPFTIGYRVHLPYIEVKMPYRQSQLPQAQQWIQSINKALQEFLIPFPEGHDSLSLLKEKLQAQERIAILDAATGPYLLEKLIPFVKSHLQKGKFFFAQEPQTDDKTNYDLQIIPLSQAQDKQVRIVCDERSLIVKAFPPQEQKYLAEMALLFWCGIVH